MKRLTTLYLALSLALTGCTLVQPGTKTPHEHTAEQGQKAAAAVINMSVSVYEYKPASVPELTALLPKEGPRAIFTRVMESQEAVINQQVATGNIQLKQQMKAATTSHQAIPFSVTNYNVLRTVEGYTVHEETAYTDNIAVVITPFHTPGASKITLNVNLAQTDKKNTIDFNQRIILTLGGKMLFMTPASPDRMLLIIITPTTGAV